MTKAYIEKIESYQATLTAGEEYQKAVSLLGDFQATRTDVPEIVADATAATTYRTTPSW